MNQTETLVTLFVTAITQLVAHTGLHWKLKLENSTLKEQLHALKDVQTQNVTRLEQALTDITAIKVTLATLEAKFSKP